MQGDLDTAFAAPALPLLSGDRADHKLDTDMEVRGGADLPETAEEDEPQPTL